MKVSGAASAVAVSAGASVDVDYANGVAIFVKGEKGLREITPDDDESPTH